MPGRTIAIGDIHGCELALSTLVDAIRPSSEDILIFLGDFIDRGPDSRGVLDQLIELRDRCEMIPLLGNHEEMLLSAMRDPGALKFWLTFGGMATIESYRSPGLPMPQTRKSWLGVRLPWREGPDPDLLELIPREHLEFIEDCQVYHETESHVFLHASYVPDVPMCDQPEQVLRWEPVDPRYVEPHCSGKTVVVGHTAQKTGEILDLGFLKCIDTFCHGGAWLTALNIESGETWQANDEGRLREKS